MLFKFLKYIQPTSYFILPRKDNTFIFPSQLTTSDILKFGLEKDDGYSNEHIKKLDLSWQAIQHGYTGDSVLKPEVSLIPLADEYRFVRKYFNPVWATYCLGVRIVSFNNPFKEIKAWWQTSNVNRKPFLLDVKPSKTWFTFDSALVKKASKISVIIPTLNRYEYLEKVLQDFERQDYANFEVIVVDQSDDYNPAFYKQFKLDIKLIRQEEKALWLARNTAIKEATGDIIGLSEDDVRIQHDWLTTHLKCLDYFNADISAGVFYPEGNNIPKERSYFAIAKQFATGNAMLYKKVFEEVGLFDRQFEKGRMGDGAFGLRCYLAGYKSISNPYASCIDVKASTGGLRELGSWDAYRPTKWLAPRPVPSVLYFYRKYYGNTLARFALLKSVPPSLIPYQYKGNNKLLILGFLVALVLFPLVLFQVMKSWRLASKKLKQGPSIEAH